VICPTCQRTNQRSIVRVALVNGAAPGAVSLKKPTPSDHFYDEEGAEHSHNPNITTTVYTCSNGHRFQEKSSWQCPCGWMVQQAEVTEL
jgi:hypothetical protein